MAFQERCVDKHYEAWVAGCVSDDAGVVDLPLAADWPNRPRQKVDMAAGKPSVTRWRLLAREEHRSHLLLHPQTGRSHQLRLHMQAMGHPILGDRLYAPADIAAAAPRLMLHAGFLSFSHPLDGSPVRLSLPADFP
jgi:tRNA pseudouridine32 synthase/23S rRNA pseudouridine746 synthase